MKRSGFTMIELVFVIVILGILASVAIPKLAATRDDAQIAKAQSEVTSLVQDIGSYYTSQGKIEGNTSKMTNVPLYTSNTAATKAEALSAANLKNGTAKAYYVDTKRKKSCLEITFNDTNGTVKVAPATGSNSGGIFCTGLVNALHTNGVLKTYKFGGSSIYK